VVCAASGKPSNKNGYKIDPTELTFMHADATTYSTASWIKRVRSWGKAMSSDEMAELAGCKLNAYSKDACTSPGVYNVRYSGVLPHVAIVARCYILLCCCLAVPVFSTDLNTVPVS
jgi:hypothetical protein